MNAVAETETGWFPQYGPQFSALQCPVEDLFYGGERGGGKSDFLLGDWLNHSDTHGRHANGILFRRTYDELTELIRRSREVYGPLGGTWRASGDPGHSWSMPSGAQLVMRYLDRDEDADHYQGHQFTWMGVDQVEAFPEAGPIDKLWGSLRSAHGIPCVRRMTGNPPAPQWLKMRYIDAAPWGKRFEYMPQPELRPDIKIQAIFIHSRLEDNKVLLDADPGYDARLAAAGSEALYRAWRMGDWDAMVGQVFKEWRRDLHVLPLFNVPPYWLPVAGLDWGYRAKFVMGIAHCGPEGDVVLVDEVVGTETHADEAGYVCGLRLLEERADERILVHSDEQMWHKSGTSGMTIAEEFQHGLTQAAHKNPDDAPVLVKSTHGRGSRLTKKQLWHRYLGWKSLSDGTIPPWGRPLLRFHRRCEYLTRSIPALMYDKRPTKAEDVDTTGDDHGYDAIGNILVSRPPLPERPVKPEDENKHPGIDRGGRKVKEYERTLAHDRDHELASRMPRRSMTRDRTEA